MGSSIVSLSNNVITVSISDNCNIIEWLQIIKHQLYCNNKTFSLPQHYLLPSYFTVCPIDRVYRCSFFNSLRGIERYLCLCLCDCSFQWLLCPMPSLFGYFPLLDYKSWINISFYIYIQKRRKGNGKYFFKRYTSIEQPFKYFKNISCRKQIVTSSFIR